MLSEYIFSRVSHDAVRFCRSGYHRSRDRHRSIRRATSVRDYSAFLLSVSKSSTQSVYSCVQGFVWPIRTYKATREPEQHRRLCVFLVPDYSTLPLRHFSLGGPWREKTTAGLELGDAERVYLSGGIFEGCVLERSTNTNHAARRDLSCEDR